VEDNNFRECVSISATGAAKFKELFDDTFWTRRMRQAWIYTYNEQQEQALEESKANTPQQAQPNQVVNGKQIMTASDDDLENWVPEAHLMS
jgi:hypothetical protein